MINRRIVTIGVYGFEAESFFAALQQAQVDLLCDIRQRRGMRGARYAFANSQRLQARLAELGIRYLQRKDLAPSPAVRQTQAEADHSQGVAKRERAALDPQFIEAYKRLHLDRFSPQAFLDALPDEVRVVAFLCVERGPEACHRSLVAASFAHELGLPVEHIE